MGGEKQGKRKGGGRETERRGIEGKGSRAAGEASKEGRKRGKGTGRGRDGVDGLFSTPRRG